MLFADEQASTGGIAVLMAMSSIIGGAVIWVVRAYSERRAERRKEHKEDEKTIVDHYEQLKVRMDREIAELRKDNRKLGRRLTHTIAHVMYLEGIMESRDIKFRPFVPPPDDPDDDNGLPPVPPPPPKT